MQLTVKEICEKIWDLENKYNLLTREFQGVKVWHLLRMNLYYDIVQETGVFGQPHTKRNGIADRIKEISSFLYSSFINNPLRGNHKKKIVVFDHPRKRIVNNKYIDIYTNYLINSLDEDDVLVLEQSYLNKHFTEPEAKRKHTDYLQILTVLMSKIYRINFNNQEAALIKTLEDEMYDLFGTKLNLNKKFLEALKKYKIRYRLYDNLFKTIKPEKIFIVVSYSYGSLIAAAKHNSIPVIEIQHGTISPYHLGYSFPNCDQELEYFPDYFYSFGQYWGESVKLPIGQDKIIPYGFPYFKDLKKDYEGIVKNTKQLLFLSQGVIGKELSRFAYQAALELKDYKIIYKLHPGEYDRWQEEYEELKLAERLENFTIVDNDKVNLYQYLAESQYQIGVFSTAVYEGFAFRCKTILIDLPGVEYMNDLVNDGFAKKVGNVEELQEALKQDNYKDIDINYFFSNM